ncbi:hypothetical protein CsSME_00043161 [Camellia sinensis var. sinensis]
MQPICLEMLYFANYSGDAESSIVRETWARLIDQALSRGGIAEACAVLKRVGSHVYPGDRAVLPLDTLCLHLEKAALERLVSGVESVGDDDVKGSSCCLQGCNRTCLEYLRPAVINWGNFAITKFEIASPPFSAGNTLMNASTTGASLILVETFSLEQTTIFYEGVRDKITSAANRCTLLRCI